MTPEQERDLAAEARHGGRFMLRRRYTDEWTPETMRECARLLSDGDGRAAMLPESCFDWPIYRAAMGLDQPEGKGARK